MKNTLALTLLTVTLAACGQNNAPSAQTAAVLRPEQQASGTRYANTQAAYDALVNADLNKLSMQTLAQQVYLNVLPVAGSPDSVRAYVKSSFASPVTCALSFGDGSAALSVQSPTTTRIQTLDHAYGTFGSYTASVTCLNNGAVVGTRSVTISAGLKPATSGLVIDFNSPAAFSGSYNYFISFQEKGFNFRDDPSYGLYTVAPDFGQNAGPSQGLYTYGIGQGTNSVVMEPINGTPFTLNSMETRSFYSGITEDLLITGHKLGGGTVTHQTHQIPDGSAVETFDASWNNLISVSITGANANADTMVIDNVNVTPGNNGI